MSSRLNNFIPEKILRRFLKGKGEKVKNKTHGSWYFNGMIDSLKPIAKRFNVMLALRGDPDYKPSDAELEKLADDMYPIEEEKTVKLLNKIIVEF